MGAWWWCCCLGRVAEVEAGDLAPALGESDGVPAVVDVRTRAKYDGGHIAGSINCSLLPVHSFARRAAALDLDQSRPLVLVCLSAHRSVAAVRHFDARGFRAKQLQGGMLAWRKAHLPEEQRAHT